MDHILACVDASPYAAAVCDLAAWAAERVTLAVELLHVVQRRDAVTERHDLSGTIGLGAKSELLEELTRLNETDARLQVERGRLLLDAAERRLRDAGADRIEIVHRHGGALETILEREAGARLIVLGKRGTGHAVASEHIGSLVERVVRASARPIMVASRDASPPRALILAYDASPAARRALERCASSALLRDLPVEIVFAGPDDADRRAALDVAAACLGTERDVRASLRPGRPEEAIAAAVAATPQALVVMGAYGHSPLRALIVGSTTTSTIRTVRAPVLLIR